MLVSECTKHLMYTVTRVGLQNAGYTVQAVQAFHANNVNMA